MSLIESAISLRNYTCENLLNITSVVDVHFFVSTIENYINFTEQETDVRRAIAFLLNSYYELYDY